MNIEAKQTVSQTVIQSIEFFISLFDVIDNCL